MAESREDLESASARASSRMERAAFVATIRAIYCRTSAAVRRELRDETADLSLEFLRSLTDQTGVEDQSVFGRIVFRLERSEESLLRTEDLHSRRRVLGQVEERSSVSDQTSSDQFSNEGGKIRSDGGHSVSEVFIQFGSVLSDGDDLVGEEMNVDQVGFGNFGSHRDGGGSLESFFQLFREDGGEVGRGVVCSESCSILSIMQHFEMMSTNP